MFTPIKPLVAALVAVAFLTALARADGPDVLSQVPDDAVAVAVIKNVDALTTQIGNYAKDMNSALPPDPLSAPLKAMGITGGFDAAGSVAFVQVNMPQPAAGAANGPRAPFVLLLPTTDAKALMAGMAPGKAVDNISPVWIRNGISYAGVMGNYVALARNRAVLADFLTHQGRMDKPAPELLKAVTDNDLTIWVDVAQEGKIISPLWNMLMTRFATSHPDADSADSQEMGIKAFETLGTMISTQVKNILITGKIDDAGITFDNTAIFVPDSPMAKFAAAEKPLVAGSLAGLPASDYVFAGSLQIDPTAFSGVMGNLVDVGLQMSPLFKDNPDLQAKFKDLTPQVLALENGAHFSVNLAPGGSGALTFTSIVDSKDPQKLFDLTLQARRLMNSDKGDIQMSTQVQPDAMKIKDISVAKVTTKMSLRAETPDNPVSELVKRQFDQMRKIIPADGMVSYIAVVGDRMVYTTNASTDTMFTNILQNKDDFTAIQAADAVKKLTLPDAAGVVYVRIDRFVELIKTITGQFANLPAAPADNSIAPAVGSFKAAGQDATFQWALPKATLLDLVQRVREVQPATNP